MTPFDPSTPVFGCRDCGTPVHPAEDLCWECELERAEPVFIPVWPIIVFVVILGLGVAILVPLCWMLWQIAEG